MLTGRWLLKPDLEEGDPWTAEDDLLAKMMELTGERFSDAPLLSRGERYKEFFDDKGNTNSTKYSSSNRICDLISPPPYRKPLANFYPRSSIIRKCSEELSNSYRQRGHRSRSVHFWLSPSRPRSKMDGRTVVSASMDGSRPTAELQRCRVRMRNWIYVYAGLYQSKNDLSFTTVKA